MSEFLSTAGPVASAFTTVNVKSGITAKNARVSTFAVQNIASGGHANNTTVDPLGVQYVAYGGTATNTTLNSGSVNQVVAGGLGGVAVGLLGIPASAIPPATQLELLVTGMETELFGRSITGTLGSLQVVNGSSLGTTVNADSAEVVGLGGVATNTTVNSHGIEFLFAGNANGTVLSGGSEVVLAGVAHGTNVYNNGIETVAAGGLAIGTAVYSGGEQDVNLGGTALLTTLSGGIERLGSGGTASGTTVGSGGWQCVDSGGIVSATTVNAGGEQDVNSGGVAIATTVVSGGTQFVDYGGIISGTTANTGGTVDVLSGGTASGIVLGAGGNVVLEAGAVVRGPIMFAGTGATLTIDGTVMPTVPVSGFGGTDTLDLAGVTYSADDTVSLTSNVLQVTSGGSVIDSIKLAGTYANGTDFYLSSDGNGGTDIGIGDALAIAAPAAEAHQVAGKDFTFTVTRTGDLSQKRDATWTVKGSDTNAATATAFGTMLPTGTVHFDAGQTIATFTVVVPALSSTFFVPTQGFTVSLSPSANTVLLKPSAAFSILGNEFTLTAAPAAITEEYSSNLIIASSPAGLNPNHTIVGMGTTTLQLGAGVYDLHNRPWMWGVDTVTMQTGQAAIGSAMQPTAYLPSSVPLTVDVTAGTAALGNKNPVGANIFGNFNDTINIQAASVAGTHVEGTSTSYATMNINDQSTAAVIMNPSDNYLTVNLESLTSNLKLSPMACLRIVADTAGDTITATQAGQTLTTMKGLDTLVGSGAFGNTLSGTVAGLDRDTFKGFGGTDKIDVTDLSFRSATLAYKASGTTGGVLTMASKLGGASAMINLTGNFTRASFLMSDDNHGGTVIKLL